MKGSKRIRARNSYGQMQHYHNRILHTTAHQVNNQLAKMDVKLTGFQFFYNKLIMEQVEQGALYTQNTNNPHRKTKTSGLQFSLCSLYMSYIF